MTEKPLFIIANHIYVIFLTNIYFIASNVLFLFLYTFVEIRSAGILILFITLLPIGPSIGALLYSMGKLVREKEISPTRDFFQGYKKNFKISLLFWLAQLLMLTVLITNLHQNELELHAILAIFFFILIFFLFLVSCYGFAILSRFEMKLKDLYVLSIYYIFKYWKRTLLNLFGGIFALLLYIQFPVISIFFLASGIGWMLMSNLKSVLAGLEEGQIW